MPPWVQNPWVPGGHFLWFVIGWVRIVLYGLPPGGFGKRGGGSGGQTAYLPGMVRCLESRNPADRNGVLTPVPRVGNAVL
jgi:hypothetical protein